MAQVRLAPLHQQRQVETADQAEAAALPVHLAPAVQAIHPLYHPAKATMAVTTLRLLPITAVAVEVAPLLLVQMAPLVQAAVTAALVQHRLFLVALLLTLVAAAVPHIKQERVALVAQAAVVQRGKRREQQLMELPTPEAAAVVGIKTLTRLAQQAAPASSSSNTTSALPQSSPSSHRRSGLHLRVR